MFFAKTEVPLQVVKSALILMMKRLKGKDNTEGEEQPVINFCCSYRAILVDDMSLQ